MRQPDGSNVRDTQPRLGRPHITVAIARAGTVGRPRTQTAYKSAKYPSGKIRWT
jgi:hypothetical protein